MIVTYEPRTHESFSYITRIVTLGYTYWKKPSDRSDGIWRLTHADSQDMRVHMSDGMVYQGRPVPFKCCIGIDEALITLKINTQTVTIEGVFLPEKKEIYDRRNNDGSADAATR